MMCVCLCVRGLCVCVREREYLYLGTAIVKDLILWFSVSGPRKSYVVV